MVRYKKGHCRTQIRSVFSGTPDLPVIPEDLSDVSVMKEADGRQYIIINNKKVYPDLLVARTFLPNMNTELYTEVEHIDGDMSNNSARNLRWIKKK